MPLELVKESVTSLSAIQSRPAPQIVEFSGCQIYDARSEVFNRLSKRAEIILIRQLPEALHVHELLLNFIRRRYSHGMAAKVRACLFEQNDRADEQVVSAFVAAARHLRDTGAMSALFGQLIRSFELPPPVNIDCGYFRFVAPDDLFRRMELRHDLVQRSDWDNPPPFDGTEPLFARGSAMPHRDISRPHYAFQINIWFPLIELSETESLLFFPDAYYDYKERIEGLLGNQSKGFEHDVREVGARIAANSNPSDWGFGKPISRKLDFGDIYIFYCQQVHGSPIRRADTLRLSVEVRAVGRSLDDNTGYRRIFSNLNNFLSADATDDADAAIKRAEAISSGNLDGEVAACAQFYLNSLFPTPAFARQAKELSQSPDTFDLGPQVTGFILKDAPEHCNRFPFAEDRSVLLARLFLRHADDATAATIISDASEQTRSYFWQLQFAYLAIRAHHKDLARTILRRCRTLAEQSSIEAFPFAAVLATPSSPILAILPEHALRAVEPLEHSIETLPDHHFGPDMWYRCDPRLFHPHNYFVRTHEKADFYKAGSLFLAIPTGQRFIPEHVVGGKITVALFGETLEQLEYEYGKHQHKFPALAVIAEAADASGAETLRKFFAERLKPMQDLLSESMEHMKSLEETMEERTNRIASLESTLDERSRRIASIEAVLELHNARLQRRIWHRLASTLGRHGSSGRLG